MRLGAAHALGHIEVHSRCGSAEQAALEALAAWCSQFTSLVSLAPPDDLLLEIGRSLALFHGLEGLVRHIHAGVSEIGYQAILAIAPTPLAAIFFVRAHRAIHLTDPQHLHDALGRLPLMWSWVSMTVSRRPSQGWGCGTSVTACACLVTD